MFFYLFGFGDKILGLKSHEMIVVCKLADKMYPLGSGIRKFFCLRRYQIHAIRFDPFCLNLIGFYVLREVYRRTGNS